MAQNGPTCPLFICSKKNCVDGILVSGPAIAPVKVADKQLGISVIISIVSVASDDAVAHILASRALPTSIASVQDSSASFQSVHAVSIDVRTSDTLGASVNDTISAIDAFAALANGCEEIVVAVAVDNSRCFNFIAQVWLGSNRVNGSSGLHRASVEFCDLETGPERAEREPGLSACVNHEVGVNSVVILAAIRSQNHALVGPGTGANRVSGSQADSRSLRAKGRDGVEYVDTVVEDVYIGSPDVHACKARHILGPPGQGLQEDLWSAHPREPVLRGQDLNTVASAKCVPAGAFFNDTWVVACNVACKCPVIRYC